MWGSGDITAVLMLVALFVQWFADSQREARREDRRLDRLEARARAQQAGATRLEPVTSAAQQPPHQELTDEQQ
jgi:hypothetical protein